MEETIITTLAAGGADSYRGIWNLILQLFCFGLGAFGSEAEAEAPLAGCCWFGGACGWGSLSPVVLLGLFQTLDGTADSDKNDQMQLRDL